MGANKRFKIAKTISNYIHIVNRNHKNDDGVFFGQVAENTKSYEQSLICLKMPTLKYRGYRGRGL